jgi:hypothetical protein
MPRTAIDNYRVLRGGAWCCDEAHGRSPGRSARTANDHYKFTSIRVMMVAQGADLLPFTSPGPDAKP